MDRPEPATASGTVTFLFSDIEGSTRLLQDLGDAYRHLLSHHHALVREAIAAWQGRVIDTAGDGFFAAFPRARDAVGGAVAIQRAIAAAEWPGGRTVAVRIGLHTGEPTLSAEGYVGLDVHRAARIGAAAAGGQVLLSKTTRDLAGPDLPAGVAFRDLGSHRLKDLHEPEHLFQLAVEGLRSEFPPLRSAGGRRLNFPATPTRLIAREADIAAVRAVLHHPGVRLVTLTGPGGTGKTRLALAVADAEADDVPDGAVFVSLASLSDARLVTTTIAHALGLMENAGLRTIDVLIAHLRTLEMLLVLDNFEQIVDAAPTIAELLAACPRISAVVTSRITLRLTGEREFPVQPLPLPDAARDDSAAALSANPAVALFVERAQAVRPDFEIDDESAPAIAELCVRLDGLPLALELAAARIRIFSPHALLARLGNRLDLLKGGARDMPERHQTLRGAISWSYELLEPQEQALFRRLAVFAGGFTLEAAEAVVEAASPLGLDIFDGVSALVERSLLRRDMDVHGEPRFGMLETVREFGTECLDHAGEVGPTTAAHARFYLAFAEAAAPRLIGSDQQRWLERLEADVDNLRAAFDGFAEADTLSPLRLGVALYKFWIVRGHLREGRRHLEECLARPGAHTPTPARARALNALSTITHELSHFTLARPMVEESLAIFRELGDEQGMANSSTGLAWIMMMIGDHAESRAMVEAALPLHRRLGNRRGEGLTIHNLAILDYFTGDLISSRSHFEQSIAVMRALGDRRADAYFSIGLSWVDREEGRWTDAARRIDEALVILAMLRDAQLTAWGLIHRGALALERGESDAAVRTLEECLALWRQVGNRFGIAWTLDLLGTAEADRGEAVRADALTREALDVWTETGSRRGRAIGLEARGEVFALAGQVAHAAPLLSEAARIVAGIHELPSLRRVLDAAVLALEPLDAEAAARLIGASDALRLRVGVVRPPRMVGHIERALDRITRSLGAEAAAALQREGNAMDSAGAAALAVRSLDTEASDAPTRSTG